MGGGWVDVKLFYGLLTAIKNICCLRLRRGVHLNDALFVIKLYHKKYLQACLIKSEAIEVGQSN